VRKIAPPEGSFRAEVMVPGDKSLSHRAFLLAAMAEGRSRVEGAAEGRDISSTMEALRRLGVEIAAGTVRSPGVRQWQPAHGPIDAGNSGTTLRLLAGALAGRPFRSTLTGDESLQRRPMRRLVEPLEALGAAVDVSPNGTAPLAVGVAGRLHGAEVEIDLASAQVRSAFELAALQADGQSVIDGPGPFRDHTERWLAALDLGRIVTPTRFEITPGPVPVIDVHVAADPSAAAFLWAATALCEGAEMATPGVSLNPGRTGFLDILQAMGAAVSVQEEGLELGDPVGTVLVRGESLRGSVIGGDLALRSLDELPLVAVLGTVADGVTEVRDAAELRVKESDRITSTVAMIAALGGSAEATKDGFIVTGGKRFSGGRVDPGGDHRIAMAAAIAAAASDDDIEIDDDDVAAVSWPGFYDVLERAWS